MSTTFAIIAAVICVLLIVLLVAAVIPKVKSGLSKMPVWVFFAAILLLVGALALLGLKLFGHHGEDSLFSKPAAGMEQGDFTEEASENAELSEALNGSTGVDGRVHVRITGDSIFLGSMCFEGSAEFSEAAEALSEELAGKEVKLEDDYAFSRTFHEVRKILEDKGIRTSEKTLE